MKALIDYLWQMPAADFLRLLGILFGLYVVARLAWGFVAGLLFARRAAQMEARQERFRARHGF